jgi:type VI protein secretion system component VasF
MSECCASPRLAGPFNKNEERGKVMEMVVLCLSLGYRGLLLRTVYNVISA